MSGYSCRSDVICHSSELHRPGWEKELALPWSVTPASSRPLGRRLLPFIFLACSDLPAATGNKSGTKQMGVRGGIFTYRSNRTILKWWVCKTWPGRLKALCLLSLLPLVFPFNFLSVFLVVTWHWLQMQNGNQKVRGQNLWLWAMRKNPLEKSPCQNDSTTGAWSEII